MPRFSVPWCVQSVVAGAVGTGAMTLAYAVEHRLRPAVPGPLDYDDSLVPGQIVARILRLPDVADRDDEQLGRVLRWTYGSAFGVGHRVLRQRMAEPRATAVFGIMVITATLTLFPLLGGTSPPWRWPASVMATCVGTHAIYAAAVGVVDNEFYPLENA